MGRDLADDLIKLKAHDDFWQNSRDAVLAKMIKSSPVIDGGCGAGVETKLLMSRGFDVYSLDYEERLVAETKKINKNTFQADLTKFNEKDAKKLKIPKVKTVLLADVIEHIEDDLAVMRNVNSLMVENGRLVISVPYHQFFWTKTDDARDHVRRYSRRELRRKLAANGFKVERVMFRSFLPIIPFMIARLFKFRIKHESVAKGWRNDFLTWYFRNIENRIPLPIGTEIICVARKVGEPRTKR